MAEVVGSATRRLQNELGRLEGLDSPPRCALTRARADGWIDSFVQLLDHETRAAEQVPLLLGMKEDRRALEKAVDSGDTDLGE